MTRYAYNHRAITIHNGDYYYNRPMYLNNLPGCIIGGDKPALKFITKSVHYGIGLFAVQYQDKLLYLHDFPDIDTYFYSNFTQWHIHNETTSLLLSVVPGYTGQSGAIKLEIISCPDNTKILYLQGGMNQANTVGSPQWEHDPTTFAHHIFNCFNPEWAKENTVSITKNRFTVDFAQSEATVECPMKAEVYIADAAQIACSSSLSANEDSPSPMAVCSCDIADGETLYWLGTFDENPELLMLQAETFYNKSKERTIKLSEVLSCNTPDEAFNTASQFITSAIDGSYYPPIYHHGAMAWNIPFPGWQTMYGASCLGWDKNIKDEAKHYISYQKQEDDGKVSPSACDDYYKMTQQAPDSRLYGKGYIAKDQAMYNFQSLFFDQMIHNLTATGDTELEKLLYPALKLHAQWQQACFDPDNMGVYESYINTWPTDTVWYGGGRGVEETVFAYNVHKMLAQMETNLNQLQQAAHHLNMCEHIKNSFHEQLWIKQKGHPGFYRDVLGKKRLHEDAWIWSVLLPLDSGDILQDHEAAETLYYPEYALEHITFENGSEHVYISNFVPYLWSVRVINESEQLNLALANFKYGFSDFGYHYLKSVITNSMYDARVPGCIGNNTTATDFNDSTGSLGRAVVEGLYGIRRDFYHDRLYIAPSFPLSWKNAKVRINYVEYEYIETDENIKIHLSVKRGITVEVKLPLKGRIVEKVSINGSQTPSSILGGYGQNYVQVTYDAKAMEAVVIMIQTRQAISYIAPITIDCNGGDSFTVGENYPVIQIHDPQGIIEYHNQQCIRVKACAGYHSFFVLIEQQNGYRFWIIYRVHIKIPVIEKSHKFIPPHSYFHPIPVEQYYNANLTEIFKQLYLTPRSPNSSCQIGTDGYTAWTMACWNMLPPEMDCSNIDSTNYSNGIFNTDIGIPFALADLTGNNIAFTSLFDNYPDRISIPIKQKGESLWFLVAGSTNPMQTLIENARITITYDDGATDFLSLTPPINLWSVCGYYKDNMCYDYTNMNHAFPLRNGRAQTVSLGKNCRANIVNVKLRKSCTVETIALETISNDVVIGIMAITLIK